MTSHSRFAVIGAGLAGSAIAWQLARRGHEVTVLERSAPANPEGSSHGSARIFRYAYPDAFYTDLVISSRREWDELERQSGTRLISPTGALDFGSERRPAELAKVLERAGIPHELVGREQAQGRWPQFVFDTEVLWHPGAGVIDAERSVHAMLALASASGARLCAEWPVAGVEREGSGYTVRSADGRSVAVEQVIVAAGAWLPDLLDRLPLPSAFRATLPVITVMQEQAFHFPYRDGFTDWPTFIHKSSGMQSYGLPGGRDADYAGQKIAEYNGGTPLRSASEQTGSVDPRNRQRLVDYVRRVVPGVEPAPYAETTCLFTNTPTEDFVIDAIDGITVVSPCSGHGAKFAPMIGAIVAESLTGSGTVPEPFLVGGDRA